MRACAIGAERPLTYNCRLALPAGTGADHTPDVDVGVQPETFCPPEITGRAPDAASQITGRPGLPESAAPNFQVPDNRYVPFSSFTVMPAPLSAASCARTRFCAPASEHGFACWHVVPVPPGDAYKVTDAAADAKLGITATSEATAVASALTAARGRLGMRVLIEDSP